MSSESQSGEEVSRRCPVCGESYTAQRGAAERSVLCPRCGGRDWFDWEKNRQIIVVNAAHGVDTEALEALATSGHVLLLDFSQVRQLSPAVPARLLGLQKKLQREGKQIRLFGLGAEASNLLRLSKMDTALPIFGSEEEALASL